MTSLRPAPRGYPIKLVRNKTAAIINSSGDPGELFYAPLKDDPRRWLRAKLLEEVGEYLIDGGLDELRDVLAVVAELAIQHSVSLERLIELVKEDPRGGFGDAVMMYGRHREFDGVEEQAS